jgi:hypothetical protein
MLVLVQIVPNIRPSGHAVGIAKDMLGFAILVHWHDTENLARVVAKVYLNDDAKISDSIKVNAGLP